jgi:hypothetical protein
MQGASIDGRGRAIEVEGRTTEVEEPAIKIEETMIEPRDVAIEIEGRVIEAKDVSKERGDDSIETGGALFAETRRTIWIEDSSIEITEKAVEAIDSFSSTARAFVSTIEQGTAIEEAFTS